MSNIKHTQDFDNPVSADVFVLSIENEYEKAAVIAMPAKNIWRVTYGNYDSKTTEEQYSEMLIRKERETAIENQRDYERVAKNNVAIHLAKEVDCLVEDFFISGFLGDNPKFTASGSINEVGQSAKKAWKAGKAARMDKENQRLIRVEAVKVRSQSLQRRTNDAAYEEAIMNISEGYSKMGPAGWDE